MTKFLTQVNNLVWGMPLILLLLGTGIYFTTHLKFIQFVRLKKAFSLIFAKFMKNVATRSLNLT